MAIDFKEETGLPYRFGRKRCARVGTNSTVIFVLVGLAFIVTVALLLASVMK